MDLLVTLILSYIPYDSLSKAKYGYVNCYYYFTYFCKFFIYILGWRLSTELGVTRMQ